MPPGSPSDVQFWGLKSFDPSRGSRIRINVGPSFAGKPGRWQRSSQNILRHTHIDGARSILRPQLFELGEVTVVVRQIKRVLLRAGKDQQVGKRNRDTGGPAAIGESNGAVPHRL